MYTSYSPNDDIFGFSTSGAFKCSYRNEMLIASAGFFPAAAAVVMFVMNFGLLLSLFDENGAIKGGLVDLDKAEPTLSSGFIGFSMTNLTNAALLILLVIGAAAAIVTFTLIRSGRTYKFKADEHGFTVIHPDGKTDTIDYYSVTDVKDKERGFPYLSRGLDITVVTKAGNYSYKLIHTSMSRVNGISETPFYIIKERAGLVKLPDFVKTAPKNGEDWTPWM